MQAKTASSTRCSAGSGRSFILRPGPARLLGAWLVLGHGLAAIGAFFLPLSPAWQVSVLWIIAAHGMLRRPVKPELIVRSRTGFWALPESGRTALRLDPATRYGGWWIDLRLAGPEGTERRLLCRDQLRAADWRVLQRVLRSPPREDLS